MCHLYFYSEKEARMAMARPDQHTSTHSDKSVSQDNIFRYRQMDHYSVDTSDSHSNQGARSNVLFDPTKYQERINTPSTSSGPSSILSLHSNDPRQSDTSSTQDNLQGFYKTSLSATASDVSSQEEFNLQNTKKVLNFESESWHEKYKTADSGDAPYGSYPHHRQLGQYGRSHSVEDMLDDKPRAKLPACVDLYYNTNINNNSHKDVLADSKVMTTGKMSSAKSKSSKSDGATTSDKSIWEVVSPLVAYRLRPIRQRTRNAIVSL